MTSTETTTTPSRDSEVAFESERLQGRRLQPAHLGAMLAVYGDPEVTRWAGDGQPLDAAQCTRWIEVTQANYALRGYGMFALVERASGEVVGFCGLVHPGQQPQAEIKYALGRRHWGRGFATEAARALVQLARQRFGLQEVIATTAPQNTASHHVLLKAGLQRRALRPNDDGSHAQIFEWRETSAPNAGTVRVAQRT
jgi:RimJ/RimL family protein N-acetyltransferase